MKKFLSSFLVAVLAVLLMASSADAQRRQAVRHPGPPLEVKPASLGMVCDAFGGCKVSSVSWAVPADVTILSTSVDREGREVYIAGPFTVSKGDEGRDWFCWVWGDPNWFQPLLPGIVEFRSHYTGVENYTVSAFVDDPPADVKVMPDGRVFVGVSNPQSVVSFNGMLSPVDAEGFATPPKPWSRGPGIRIAVCRSSLFLTQGSLQSTTALWPNSRCRTAVKDIPAEATGN
jgi:hypothetical protein